MKTGDLFERTYHTSKGPIDVLAEVVVDGRQLWLRDIAVFGRGVEPMTDLVADAFAVRTQIMNEAKSLGFEQLRITGIRVASSSSANPGHPVDVVVNLSD